jgi:chromosome segregation ATPase
MIKNTLIIALVIVIIYLYYQQRQKPNLLGESKVDQSFQNFLQTNLNSNSLEELQTKLGEKSLDELIEENQDYETEVDTLTRSKNSLEQDLTSQSNAFQSRLREKDREIKKLKEDLSSEKQQHKGSIGRITKLTEQITNLEKKHQNMPGEFPEENKAELTKTHQEQLRKINLLFDEKAKDYKTIDFNGLYQLLKEKVGKK